MLRVLGFGKFIVLAALLLGLGYFAYVQGAFELLAGFGSKKLVPAEAVVLLNGKPVTGFDVKVRTFPDDDADAAWGVRDDRGVFVFYSHDEERRVVPGISAGLHKVTVGLYGVSSGAGPAPLLSPQEYASVVATPFTMKISRNPNKNKSFQFNLVADIQPPTGPPGPAASGPGPAAPGAGAPGGGPPGTAAASGANRPLSETNRLRLNVTFKRRDTDGDNKLSREEVQQISAEDRATLKMDGADADGDGFLTREELQWAINSG